MNGPLRAAVAIPPVKEHPVYETGWARDWENNGTPVSNRRAFRQSRYSVSYFLCLLRKTCSLKAIPASTELRANQTSVTLYTDLKFFHKQMSKRKLSFTDKLPKSSRDSWPRVNHRSSFSYCTHLLSLSLRFYCLKPLLGLSAALKGSDRCPFPHNRRLLSTESPKPLHLKVTHQPHQDTVGSLFEAY